MAVPLTNSRDVQHSMNYTLTVVQADNRYTRAGVQSIASELLVVRSEAALANTNLLEIAAALPAIAKDAAKTGPLVRYQFGRLAITLAEQNRTINEGFTKGKQMNAEHYHEVMQKMDRLEALYQRSNAHHIHNAQGQRANEAAARLMSKPSVLREVVDGTESSTMTIYGKMLTQMSSSNPTSPTKQALWGSVRCQCRRPRRLRQ